MTTVTVVLFIVTVTMVAMVTAVSRCINHRRRVVVNGLAVNHARRGRINDRGRIVGRGRVVNRRGCDDHRQRQADADGYTSVGGGCTTAQGQTR